MPEHMSAETVRKRANALSPRTCVARWSATVVWKSLLSATRLMFACSGPPAVSETREKCVLDTYNSRQMFNLLSHPPHSRIQGVLFKEVFLSLAFGLDSELTPFAQFATLLNCGSPIRKCTVHMFQLFTYN